MRFETRSGRKLRSNEFTAEIDYTQNESRW
jgi:hypothetical protein